MNCCGKEKKVQGAKIDVGNVRPVRADKYWRITTVIATEKNSIQSGNACRGLQDHGSQFGGSDAELENEEGRPAD
jgi:hypothetical protein